MKISAYKNRLTSDPFLDWVIILTLAFVVLLTLVGVGLYVYLLTDASLSRQVPAAKAAAMPLDEKKLGSVLHEFDARKERTAAILKSYSAPPDPSLP